MRLNHFGLFVQDLERERHFFETYFNASAEPLYHNPRTGLKCYFLDFPDGDARLELMTRPDLVLREKDALDIGFIHLSFSLGGRSAVDDAAARMKTDGYSVVDGPRVCGDGSYEACVLDPEGNRIEMTV